MVITNVWTGLMLGRTANTVSPTSPREVEATPESLMMIFWMPNFCATVTASVRGILFNGRTHPSRVLDQKL